MPAGEGTDGDVRGKLLMGFGGTSEPASKNDSQDIFSLVFALLNTL